MEITLQSNDLRIYNIYGKSGEIISKVMADHFLKVDKAIRFERNKIAVAIFKLDEIAGFAEMFEIKELPKRAIKIKLDNGAIKPTRAHNTDAGLDIYAKEDVYIHVPARGSVVVDTGVHIEIPKGYAGFLKSKSGLNVKHGITSEGVIDCGYTGSIRVKLYNNSDKDYEIKEGDKISQLVILPIITPELELVETEEELYGGATERGAGGFGSTGR